MCSSDLRMERMGAFVLASIVDIAAPDVLDAYYARQRIEQVFDVGKKLRLAAAPARPLRGGAEGPPAAHVLRDGAVVPPAVEDPRGGIVDAAGAGGRAQPEVQGMRRQGNHLRAHVGRERALSGDRRQVPGGGSVRLW